MALILRAIAHPMRALFGRLKNRRHQFTLSTTTLPEATRSSRKVFPYPEVEEPSWDFLYQHPAELVCPVQIPEITDVPLSICMRSQMLLEDASIAAIPCLGLARRSPGSQRNFQGNTHSDITRVKMVRTVSEE